MKRILLLIYIFLLGMLFYSCSSATSSIVTLKSISIDPPAIENFQVTDTVSVTVTALYSDNSTEDVTGDTTFAESSIASVTEDGTLKALAKGTALVILDYNGKMTSLSVSTIETSTGITLNFGSSTDSLKIGDSVPLSATLHHADGGSNVVTPEDGLTVPTGFGYSNGELKVLDGPITTVTASIFDHTDVVELTNPIPAYEFLSRRAISVADLERRAVSYSGYREGQSPENQTYPSEAEIAEDLALLKQAGFGFLRLYDTSTHARRTLNVIRDSFPGDFKVLLGVWIEDQTVEENWVQTDGAIELATSSDFEDIIAAISVGNECMVGWNTWAPAEPSTIRTFVQYIRENVTQPVTTDDNWAPFSGASPSALEVAGVLDFLAIHTYPIADTPWDLWDWQQESVDIADRPRAMMDAARDRAMAQYDGVRTAMDNKGLTDLPIIIGETGWKHVETKGSSDEQYLGVDRPHPVNASMYYNDMITWVYENGRDGATDPLSRPMAVFYFEAFDEPWKQGDDGWGLFDVDRTANYAIYSLNAQYSAPFPIRAADGALGLDDAVCYTGP